MRNMKNQVRYLSIGLMMSLVTLISCQSRYEKCKQHYIDEEGYSYEEACDQCDEEEDAHIQSTAR